MKYELVDRKDVPDPIKPSQSKMMNDSMELINALTSGKVAKIEIEDGAKSRGIKSSLTRASKKLNKPVHIWEAENNIYVELT